MKIKTIKMSSKGQIAIPEDMRREANIGEGDTLIIAEEGGRILLEKQERIAEDLADEFEDMIKLTERSLKGLWGGKEEDIWNEYLEDGKNAR
jgi:AbrB family looped-hinge helix DNA binding protein